MTDKILEVRGLTKTYGGEKKPGAKQPTPTLDVLKGIDIDIYRGDVVCLIGPSGCGKSTFLKLALGLYEPQEGEVAIWLDEKKITGTGMRSCISYVPQDTSELRGSLASFIQAGNIDKTLFLTILRKMDFSRELFEKPMESYSSGQKKKVLLAGSLSESAHLYIWDEPLNYIDIFSRMQLEAFIKKVQPTMLIVEHDRKFVENVVNSVISVDDEY